MAREDETRLVYSTDAPEEARVRRRGRRRDAPRPAPPSRKSGVRLRLERRASDRLVTVVSGLPGASEEVAALARELKAACGTGGTLKRETLELQGDQRERVEALLAARGVPSKRAGG